MSAGRYAGLGIGVAVGIFLAGGGRAAARAAPPATFTAAAGAAVGALERDWTARGGWNACLPARCGVISHDWGADVLTGTLVFRYRAAGDRSVIPYLRAAGAALPRYGRCRLPVCREWSDVPLWDAVAAARIFTVTHDPGMLDKARRALAFVADSDAFARGACPAIPYQHPAGETNRLKTLETSANDVTAALLLYRLTHDSADLQRARRGYAAARRFFFDRTAGLYTVYLFDDGRQCRALPRRFFGSVNGLMIAAGLDLADLTATASYRREALATARAVTTRLADAGGIYADLQADNDVAAPLVEAMTRLAMSGRAAFARRWILAAAAARTATSGRYGRFFDGPAPRGPVSAWAASGGLSLAIAAAALAPTGRTAPDSWARALTVTRQVTTLPARITFRGRGIALFGTLGALCCEPGRARLLVDGREPPDATGIWQNKSASLAPLPHTILFAWRWSHAGRHTIELRADQPNAKEGGPFIRLDGYAVSP